eukprot:CAMPEP_0115883938 /NCGR_PEP_ID=MMETSP0287-20121206/29846_1 /TAXON_ID=412157 /ORGANISM="Chrysochromulina rotalis, Strain UIO044" /LENGTH=326 /DNA_ID=CAMNT_0003340199 /DNA_START=37 /DNA_END=1019 /DNA_ORIENTATION=+
MAVGCSHKQSHTSVKRNANATHGDRTACSDEDSRTIEIALAADVTHLPGIAGVIRSARHHASMPLNFYVITLAEHEASVRRSLECFGVCGPDTQLAACVTIVLLPLAWLAGCERNWVTALTTQLCALLLATPFAANAAASPYLDADVILQKDIVALWHAAMSLPGIAIAAAVPRDEPHFRYRRYAKQCSTIFAARYHHELNYSAPTFNAGLLAIDLHRWEAANLSHEADWWMEQHAAAANGLWALGSQPILHLILHGRWSPLPAHWNLDGLGRVRHMAPALLRNAHSLHWTGRRKPWRPDGLYPQLYQEFVAVPEVHKCAGRQVYR